MSNLTKDYGNWGTTLDISNPDVWILLVIITFIAIVITIIFIYIFKN